MSGSELVLAFLSVGPSMNYDLTRSVLEALERASVKYVVFGAVALNLHGLARATEDLDLFVAPERENLENLKRALFSVFEDPHIHEIDADELMGEYPAVQYVPPEEGFHVDILTRLGEAWAFDDLDAEKVEYDGLQISVATPETLFRMKRSTVRPKDWGDAEALQRRFQIETTDADS